MSTSEEDLQKQADTVASLRQEVEEAEALRVQRETDASADLSMTLMQTEEAQLRARLAAAKSANSASAVKAGTDAPIAAAKEALKAAVAQQKAAEAEPTKKEEASQIPTSQPSPPATPTEPNGGNN